MYDFIERLAPHLSRERIRTAEKLETQEKVDTFSAQFHVPLRGNRRLSRDK
jgi:hypothetical protein